ncbi:hypothetical protein [Compostimonas suwonensis]|uniref:Cell division protein FtsL n=1 Tax=Compostimonas suwonensis TaxID=1048394 RepID=A0A2M9BAY3_9MICO|nr:hypothetical protein [Compostimonas suwonensis]PJJ55099.1 hypothetical protein CLV54_3438 [Compostimonas suwonensis]
MTDTLATAAIPDWALPNPTRRPDEAPEQHERAPHIEIVSTRGQRKARPRTIYAAIVIVGIIVIVIAQLLLSVGLSQGAYEISSLQESQKDLTRTASSISEDLDRVSSPQNLAANAEALGMVSNTSPVYLRLSDGAVLGVPAPAQGSAGSLIGPAGLTPNSLLAGVPLVTQLPADQAPDAATQPVSGTPVQTPAVTPDAQLPLHSGLPSPTTH